MSAAPANLRILLRDQIIETLAGFAAAGVTRVEIIPYPNTMETVELLTPVLSALM